MKQALPLQTHVCHFAMRTLFPMKTIIFVSDSFKRSTPVAGVAALAAATACRSCCCCTCRRCCRCAAAACTVAPATHTMRYQETHPLTFKKHIFEVTTLRVPAVAVDIHRKRRTCTIGTTCLYFNEKICFCKRDNFKRSVHASKDARGWCCCSCRCWSCCRCGCRRCSRCSAAASVAQANTQCDTMKHARSHLMKSKQQFVK